jgi:putative ABC transport system permease protein
MWFSTFVLKNLARRPLRSLLTVFAIAIAIGSVVSLVGVATGFERTFLQLYEGAGVDLVVVRAGARQRLNSSLDESIGDKIRSIPGALEVLPGLADVVSFEEANLYGVVVQGWKPATAVFSHITIKQGRSLTPSDTKAVLLGTILSRNLEKNVGDTIELMQDERFAIVGVYESSNVFENGAMIIPLTELQRIMDRPHQVTGFSVILKDSSPAAVDETRRRIEALVPGVAAMSIREHVNSISEIRLAKGMAWLTSAIALVIGFFGMMNTMVMSVHERTREIGILRAVGWRVRRVIRMVLLEAVFLSLLGATCGTIGAWAILRVLTKVPAVNGVIDGRIDPILMAYGFAIAIGVGLLGGLIPAQRAAKMMPTEALRHE